MPRHSVIFIDAQSDGVTLPVECSSEQIDRFAKAFANVAKCIPIQKKRLLAAYLKDQVPHFCIVIEDAVLLATVLNGKRKTAMGLIEPHVAAIRFAGTIVAEMSDDQVEDLIAHELGHAVLYVEEKTGNVCDELLDEWRPDMSPEQIRCLNEKYAEKHASEWGFPEKDMTEWIAEYAKRHDLVPSSSVAHEEKEA